MKVSIKKRIKEIDDQLLKIESLDEAFVGSYTKTKLKDYYEKLRAEVANEIGRKR